MNTQPCKNQSKSSSAAVIKHSNVLFFRDLHFGEQYLASAVRMKVRLICSYQCLTSEHCPSG